MISSAKPDFWKNSIFMALIFTTFYQLFSQKFCIKPLGTPAAVLAGPRLGVIEKSISYSEKYAGGSGESEKIIFRPEKGV